MKKDPPNLDLPVINYSRIFDKQLKKAPLEIKIAFRNKLELFLQDPLHPKLNNHKLTGTLKSFRSINVNGDWRAVYTENDQEIVFEMLGTHSQLYK